MRRMKTRASFYWSSLKIWKKIAVTILCFYIVVRILEMILYSMRKPSYYTTIQFDGLKCDLGVRDRTPEEYNTTVVLLHSDRYDSRIWEDLGTLDALHKMGYRALAIDLPGHGFSYYSDIPVEYYEKASLLEFALKKLNATDSIIVAPSISGIYALPILVRGKLELKGFVALAPHSTERFSQLEYRRVTIPTLIVYGHDDVEYGLRSARHLQDIPSSKVNVVKRAALDCYVSYPQNFHAYLYTFIQDLSN